jgi:hypothetical protein
MPPHNTEAPMALPEFIAYFGSWPGGGPLRR